MLRCRRIDLLLLFHVEEDVGLILVGQTDWRLSLTSDTEIVAKISTITVGISRAWRRKIVFVVVHYELGRHNYQFRRDKLVVALTWLA